MSMTSKEIADFLSNPYLADLATIKPGGAPHLTPVWYLYDGEYIYITSRPGRTKVRNIRRDPRVALCVHDPRPPYKGVTAEGTAEIVEDGAAELTSELAVRYLGEEGIAYAQGLNQFKRIVIKIKPDRLVSWDYSKEP